MKINRLETHDRLLHFHKDQWENIAQGANDCMTKNPLSLAIQEKCPYVYIFAHPRTAENGVDKRMLWQPRVSRPSPQTNSYLFRGFSKTDMVEICWLLPPEEMWGQYDSGKVTANEYVMWSINQYKTNRIFLGLPHPEDLSDEKGRFIYRDVVQSMQKSKKKFTPIL